MSDIENFAVMMTRIGANPTLTQYEDGGVSIDLEIDHNNISGYMGFVATFDFDKDGNLKGVGIYE